MDLLNIFNEKCVKTESDDKDKLSVLKTIAILATKNSILKNHTVDDVYTGLVEREKLFSTGVGNGVAIPHCALEGISDFVIGLITIPNGIDFDAIDGKKTKLFTFIIAPKSKKNEHIKLLSKISSVLNLNEAVEQMLSAQTPKDLYAIFLNYLKRSEERDRPESISMIESCLFHVFVQSEDKFNDVLQIFADIDSFSVSVVEANTAMQYLYSLPLFASFWNKENNRYNRIIIAIVPKKLSNEIIRRVNLIIEELDDKQGIMVTTNDITYYNGSTSL